MIRRKEWDSADSTTVERYEAGVITGRVERKFDKVVVEYGNDGQGNTYHREFDVGRRLVYERWTQDGASGQSRLLSDGRRVGAVIQPDGSYVRTETSADGMLSSRSYYDASGHNLGQEWKTERGDAGRTTVLPNGTIQIERNSRRDGTIVAIFPADGRPASIRQVLPDGRERIVSDDLNGNRIDTTYGPGGIGIESNTTIRYSADGSGIVTTTDASGRTSETRYGTGTLGPLAKPDARDDALPHTDLPSPVLDARVPEIYVPFVMPDADTLRSIDPLPPMLIQEIERNRDAAEQKFETVVSPLVLDMDGDGVETIAFSEGVYFDHNGNGLPQRTGWIGQDDALLALDLDGNGRIDSGRELFGDNTRMASGQLAANGFEALKRYDGNADGRIDAADAIFSRLLLWRDANSNGVSEADELLSLPTGGVSWISTAYETSSKVDSQGNQRRQVGTFADALGAVHQVHDVWFDQGKSKAGTAAAPTSALSAEVLAQPNIEAFGALTDLHTAMAADAVLLGLVQQFAGTTVNDSASRRALDERIALRWSGADQVQFGIDSPYYDERHLFAIDIASGRAAYDRNYNDRPQAGPQAAPYIEAGFNAFIEVVQFSLSQGDPLVRAPSAFTVVQKSDGTRGLYWSGYDQSLRRPNDRCDGRELARFGCCMAPESSYGRIRVLPA